MVVPVAGQVGMARSSVVVISLFLPGTIILQEVIPFPVKLGMSLGLGGAIGHAGFELLDARSEAFDGFHGQWVILGLAHLRAGQVVGVYGLADLVLPDMVPGLENVKVSVGFVHQKQNVFEVFFGAGSV